MSDPMTNQRPVDPPPPPPEVVQRKSASPLIWILLLIALIAFAWYFYNRNGGTGTSPDMTPPPATSDAMTPNAGDSPEKIPTKAKPAKPAVVAKVETRRRDVALIGNPKPSYPPEAFRVGEEGTVVVMADVDASGNVSSATLADRSGSRILDRAAVNEVRRWKFKPAMKGGKAVASSVRVPVDYKLADGQQ